MRREKNKSPNVFSHFAELEVQPWVQFQRVLAQGSNRWRLGIGIGLIVCAVVVIAYLRNQPVSGVEELREGILLLDDGDDPTKAAAQLRSAERNLAGSEELYLFQLILFKLGNIEEKKGNLLEARRQYEASAEIAGPLKAESLLATARVLTLMKDDSSAYYRKLLAQYPDFPMRE
ncbi:MAG: hypothetical protein AB1540_17960, partial [Bdellovibrionota bacterium]